MANLENPVVSVVTDGDAAFLRVDNRKPAHMLQPGEVAEAMNQRFDFGKAVPRFGVANEAWGCPGNVFARKVYPVLTPPNYVMSVAFTTLVIGQSYRYQLGPNEWALTFDAVGDDPNFTYIGAAFDGNGDPVFGTGESGEFIARGNTVVADGRGGEPVTARVWPAGELASHRRSVGYVRFNDPNSFDCGILLTDDWRLGSGEDKGRGRAWRIMPNNLPVEIPLNGHDVWGTCWLTQCFNGMVLHRHGNERHYFEASAFISEAAGSHKSTILLNCLPGWKAGDRVQLMPADTSVAFTVFGAAPPAVPGYAYVKQESGNYFELYQTADTTGTGTKFKWTSATGRFYLERASNNPGFFGNGAPGLILEPNDLLSAFENGWRAVSANVPITNTDTTGAITAPNHRLMPGDGAVITPVTWTLHDASAGDIPLTTVVYVAPLNEHSFRVYGTMANALLDKGTATGATGLLVPSASGGLGSLAKDGAAGLPMPPLRSSVFFKGRLVGINGRDNLVISDPMDFLHYSLFTGLVPANLGEAGQANWLLPLGEDTLLIGKDNAILILYNLSGEVTSWRLDVVTQEYGGVAPLAALNVGSDGQFLSRKGWVSVQRTVAGERLAVTVPLSDSIPRDLDRVDWYRAKGACAVLWQNRLLVALPGKGQDLDVPVNDLVLSHNQRNQTLRVQQVGLGGEMLGQTSEGEAALPSWEGSWLGSLLTPAGFVVINANGKEYLTFALPDGRVCYFDDDWQDELDVAISTRLVSRSYFGGKTVLALSGQANWETFRPKISVKVRLPGYAEEETVEAALEYKNTEFLADGASGTDFTQAHRADYAMDPDAGLYSEGVAMDVHQAISEPLRLRVRGHGPQLVIENTQGSCRICGLALSGVAVRVTARTS